MNVPSLSKKEQRILQLLISNGEMYGLEMVKADSALKRGTIYVTLGRMADKGYVESRQVKEEGRPGLPKRVFRASALGARVYDAWQIAHAAIKEAYA